METDFAFLADSAEVINGKLYVLGGAFDTIWAAQEPIVHSSLTFVMRFLFSAAEVGIKHKLEIHIMDEDGKRIAPTIGGDLEIHHNPNLPKGWKYNFLSVLNLKNIKFEKFGDYNLNILVNNSNVKSVLLRVAKQIKLPTV